MTDLQRAQSLFARTGDMRIWDLCDELMDGYTVRSELRNQSSILPNSLEQTRTVRPLTHASPGEIRGLPGQQ
jgi:hypothetical protein